ncbi:MAG: RelA/SpoT family protein [bacterium]|nr:RelA/SpoT family protein [bacterium]
MEWTEYEKKLKEFGYKDEAIAKIKPVFEFASDAHKDEKRFSGEQYIVHPIATSLKIAALRLDSDTISAALLHDVVENQNIKIEELKKKFGEDIAFLVEGVTKVDKVRYHGIERTVESLRKMFLALASDIRVVIIKLMDRVHNMETLEYVRPEKQKRIALETLELYAPLADRLGIWEIKAQLEDLAFPYIYPEEYKWLKNQIKERKEVGEQYLSKLKPIIAAELEKEGILNAKIVYRAKHMLSIWKKLLKNEMNFDRIFDLVSMRVIVGSVADCYKALGILHKTWKPMPGRIKDYIALPKPNGYRSLHTTVFGPGKKHIDFQIRTVEMDNEAENGIAAHWFYEVEGKKKAIKKLDDKKFLWVRQLQDWQAEYAGSSAPETLSALKIDFFKDRIFALTPKGDVIDLPDGATPIDFAYHVHSEIGDKMSGAKVNEKIVPFSHRLKLGDTVEILTQKNKKPTADWLDFAKTSIAKNRIRAFLRKEGGGNIGKTSDKNLNNSLEAVITAKDRVGILRDISTVFSNLDINIIGTKSGPLSRDHHRIIVSFEHKKGVPNTKLLSSIRRIKNVEAVVITEVK